MWILSVFSQADIAIIAIVGLLFKLLFNLVKGLSQRIDRLEKKN